MSNKKKIPFMVLALLYAFLILGVIGGFFALAAIISFAFGIDLFVVLVIEVILLLGVSYAALEYVSNFDELDITFTEDDDKESML